VNEITQSLSQDAQVLKERMPMGTPIEQARQIADALQRFMDDNDLTVKRVAQICGVSTSVICQLRSRRYTGDVATMAAKVTDAINSYSRRAVHEKPVYVHTTVARRIHDLIVTTDSYSGDDEGKIGMVIGDAGHGKSVCLQQFAAAHPMAIYCKLSAAMTPTSMFAAIAEAARIDSAGSLPTITQRIITRLQNRHVILLLDEASELSIRQLNLIRQVLVTDARCPVVLAGNRDLHDTIMQATSRRGTKSLDQFVSRLMQILDLDAEAQGSRGDDGLYTAEDIRKVYSQRACG